MNNYNGLLAEVIKIELVIEKLGSNLKNHSGILGIF